MALACKAGEFCCAIDMDFQLTEIWASQKMIPRKRVTRCLLFLHIPLGRTLKKKTKNKTKQKSLFCMQAIFLVHQSTTTRYRFNALFQSTVTLTLISQLLL